MSVLRRDDVSVDGDIGIGEEAAEGGEFGVGVGIGGTVFTEVGRRFSCDGSAVTDGEERGFVGFEFVEEGGESGEGGGVG